MRATENGELTPRRRSCARHGHSLSYPTTQNSSADVREAPTRIMTGTGSFVVAVDPWEEYRSGGKWDDRRLER
jgi:hypothetical protein